MPILALWLKSLFRAPLCARNGEPVRNNLMADKGQKTTGILPWDPVEDRCGPKRSGPLDGRRRVPGFVVGAVEARSSRPHGAGALHSKGEGVRRSIKNYAPALIRRGIEFARG